VQEKVFRQPTAIHVCVAELVPRSAGSFEMYDHYPDYFSKHTYWTSDKLWKFIGVPFEIVSTAIASVATKFQDQLKGGLRDLLPDAVQLPDTLSKLAAMKKRKKKR
jgi:hypothetical protein